MTRPANVPECAYAYSNSDGSTTWRWTDEEGPNAVTVNLPKAAPVFHVPGAEVPIPDPHPGMKRYTPDNVFDMVDGWYWCRRYNGCTPTVVPVYWSDTQKGGRLTINHGYRSETYVYPDHPVFSDDLDPELVLIGPIQPPLEMK